MGMRGYSWDKRLLLHTIVDSVGSVVIRIVVPKSRIENLLELAHDKIGHVGARKVADTIGKRFVWPNVSADIHKYCASCLVCQKSSRHGLAYKAPMVERPVVSEPLKVVAMDIVGPLPPRKGKCHVLVYSNSVEEHKHDVRKVLCALREAGLTAKRKKGMGIKTCGVFGS